MKQPHDPPRYREIQRWSDISLVMVIVLGIAAVQWWGFIRQVILSQPAGIQGTADWLITVLWVVLGIGLPVLAFWLRMVVEVYPDRIVIHYRPLAPQTIRLFDVASVEPRVYGQVPGVGAWGAPVPNGARVFNISAQTAVQVILRGRMRLLIGTRTPDRLAEAIYAARYDIQK